MSSGEVYGRIADFIIRGSEVSCKCIQSVVWYFDSRFAISDLAPRNQYLFLYALPISDYGHGPSKTLSLSITYGDHLSFHPPIHVHACSYSILESALDSKSVAPY